MTSNQEKCATPWVIDGRRGEGGGQVLRTSIALSIVTGTPLILENIRGGRKTPGLLAQHLCAVKAAARVCSGHVDGATLASERLEFTPNAPHAGVFDFDVGTAGSATLVLQTILYPLWFAGGKSEVSVGGGTHNLAAPPVPFLDLAFAPQVRKQNAHLDVTLERVGFYPRGGGRLSAVVDGARRTGARRLGGLPSRRLELDDRGKHLRTHALISFAGLPPRIPKEEAEQLAGALKLRPAQIKIEERTDSKGAGNAVFVIVEHEHATEVFTGFGERRVRAKDVALKAATAARRYLNGSWAVAEHLADQLILPIVFGGGSFTTGPLAKHTSTQIELVRELIGVEIGVEREDGKRTRVSVDVPYSPEFARTAMSPEETASEGKSG